MYREIINDLEKWKVKSRRKPLLLTGVRQCGKTYIVEEFAKESFDNYVYVNFEKEAGVSAIFDYDFDVDRIITELERKYQTKVTKGKTLVFFDEIQECPRAITSLKYFCENMKDLHVICAGSLLGVAIKSENISFPVGKVNRMQLYPMSFKEFVIANDRRDLIEVFENWPTDRVIPELYSVPMTKLLKEYYIVGGMPEAVKTWIETHDINEVEEVLQEILSDYADDFSKHAPVNEIPKIRWIWDSVPVQLAKENNKFVFSHVKAGKRSAELEDALQWLSDAGLITQVHLVEKPESPLSGFADKTYFKVYMSDVGLLRVKSGVAAKTILEGTELFVRYKGAFVENYVLNELKSCGKELYFWRSGNTAEIDFIYEKDGEIVPVEVKAADNTQAKSYKQFCKKYDVKHGFKLSQKNIAENMCENTKTYNIPLYLGWNIDEYN
ncbi:ATP-binding protein [Butyrivibrio sp. AC2005]|uniref:ATP-binding protein n=1 Tax=Butyrivibrio sp. AC2005 TaxID=1280672 RepID=UPI00040461BC|nr:ATP-binding protein [Butyrivibrio sp. AC2005]